jgi:hypothetical protein
MKFDPTKPVQTRDGRPARIIMTDAQNESYPIVALVLDGDQESPNSFTAEGRFYVEEDEDDLDLINVSEKRRFWVNIPPDGRFSKGHDSEDAARAAVKGIEYRFEAIAHLVEYEVPAKGE